MSANRIGLQLPLLVLLLVSLLAPNAHASYLHDPGAIPLRRSLPNGIDMLESSLYWLQDLSGVEDPRDPAAIIGLMEDQAARFFDFAYMSYLVGGPSYVAMNALDRSHFQNRVRDELFSRLARQMGMYSSRLPRFRPQVPVRTGLYSWKIGSEFFHRGGPYIRLQFHFYLSGKGWRIYDVTSNGESAINMLRRRFAK